jgi:hypothetical protein
MRINVLGMDPSLRNWGLVEGSLDLSSGILDILRTSVVRPKDPEGKQVRQNSKDLYLAEQLGEVVIPASQKAKVIFVEVPVGSKSARAMASYGMCVGVLGAVRALGVPLIEVTALESKLVFTSDRNATKRMMIDQAINLYPDIDLPRNNSGKVQDQAEHIADALAAIHSGVKTPMFQNLMRIFNEV